MTKLFQEDTKLMVGVFFDQMYFSCLYYTGLVYLNAQDIDLQLSLSFARGSLMDSYLFQHMKKPLVLILLIEAK